MELNNLKEQIIQNINTSGLSIDAVYFVMKDIMNEIVNLYNQQIEIERAAAAQESEEQDSENEESAAA